MILKRDKAKSLSVLIAELDTQLSLYVRLNAADAYGTIRCISCDDRVWWKEAECCHFKDRKHMGTRFYLPNLAAGCHNCNCYEKESHIETWENKLTALQIDDLNNRARSLMKWTKYEIEQLILDYRDKVAKLRKEKNI